MALAYVAIAAGLLLGSGGELFLGVSCAAAAIVAGAVRRLGVVVALGVIGLAGTALGALTAASDVSCASGIEQSGAATVRLREPARPGVTARGYAIGPACRVPVRLRVTGGQAAAGATVRALGDARRQGAVVVMPAARLRAVAPPGILARWRARTGALIDTLYGEHAPLARALVIADERDIDHGVRARFSDAGIIHMVSVSGLHVAVLAEAIVLIATLCRVPTRRAEVVATGVVAVFVAFVGAPSPAIRSAAMYAAVVASRRLQRPTSPWALLALGAAVPLIEPRVVQEIGYHLSVSGMAALIGAGSLWRRLPQDRLPGFVRRIGREMLATVVASAVTGPIVAWHFGRISLAAPLTNLAVAPLFTLAQPALFLSVVIAPLRPAAQLVADGTALLLSGIDHVARLGAAIPFAAIDVMPSAVTAWCVAVASVAVLAACTTHFWVRPLAAAGLVVGAALWWPLVRPSSGSMEVHMIDVGQGDAIAIRTPGARWILVDAGDAWRNTDVGERVVAPYIRRRGGDIALMILSHPHADHIGGAASVINRIPVRRVWDGAFAQGSSVYDGVLQAARQRGTEWVRVSSGDTLSLDGVRLVVLAPDSAGVEHSRDANEASVVVLVEFQGVRILLTGDLEQEQEHELVRQAAGRLRADILKVGHHGSNTSTTDALLAEVMPRLALVSVGADNRYGHPGPAVMDRLRSRAVHVLRTDHDGTIVLTVQDGWIRVAAAGGRWQLRAAPVTDRRP